jgi:hypothetical protein
MKRAMVRAVRAMATAMKVAGSKEGKGCKAMVIRISVAGKRWQRQQRGQWQRRQGWWASNGNGNKESNGDNNKGGREEVVAKQLLMVNPSYLIMVE